MNEELFLKVCEGYTPTKEERKILKATEELTLIFNNIKNLSALKYVPNLRSLDLSGTQIRDLTGLEHVPNLQHLYLSRTQIRDLTGLEHVPNLQTLDLSGTQIRDLTGLEHVPNLQELSLRGTQISDLTGLRDMPNLQGLYLSRTQIRDLTGLEHVPNLQELDLSETQIQDIGALISLKYLKKLDLSHLRLRGIPKELVELELPFMFEEYAWVNTEKAICLYNTELTTQPISLFRQQQDLIEAYYEEEQIPVNEAKVIFLGDCGAGKTHTVRRIENGGEPLEETPDPTKGIDIIDISHLPTDDGTTVHFWDFGGDEIMHAMHRCFLTGRTLYVIVVSSRFEDMDRQAKFWLKNVESFAKDAPVLIAVNRWQDTNRGGINESGLENEYPNLVGVVKYSAVSGKEDFLPFVECIHREVRKLDSNAMTLPKPWADIRAELLKLAEKEPYIDKDKYHSICEDHGLADEEIRKWLLEWFNDLGTCFSYHREGKKELDSYKVLNPKWLINAIYILINHAQEYADNGLIRHANIRDLLNRQELGVIPGFTYQENDWRYILEVMRKFRLSYTVSAGKEFIPALCEVNTPKALHPDRYERRIRYEMRYKYLPDSVIHQLMILCYKDLNPHMLWRKGLRLDIGFTGLTGVVELVDDEKLRITVYSTGSGAPWMLLSDLRSKIQDINAGMELEAKDYIVAEKDGKSYEVAVNALLARKKKGKREISLYNDEDSEDFLIDEILGDVYGPLILSKEKNGIEELERAIRTPGSITNNYYNCSFGTGDAESLISLLKAEQAKNSEIMQLLIQGLLNLNDPSAKEAAEKLKADKNAGWAFLETWAKRSENMQKLISAASKIPLLLPVISQFGEIAENVMPGIIG